jgi:uncharacterized repeat protein (TIGR04076 family)
MAHVNENMKALFGYNDEQWEKFKNNKRYLKYVENFGEFSKYKIVAEVTSSYGCAAGHKVGDRIVFSGGGGLLCKESPDQICFGLLSPACRFLPVLMERIGNGEDPNNFVMNKVHCQDVGLDHGGWGEVVAELKVEKVQE